MVAFRLSPLAVALTAATGWAQDKTCAPGALPSGLCVTSANQYRWRKSTKASVCRRMAMQHSHE